MKELLTIQELSKVLKVCEMTIYRHRKKGLPSIKIGGLTRYDLDEVLEYFKNKQEENE